MCWRGPTTEEGARGGAGRDGPLESALAQTPGRRGNRARAKAIRLLRDNAWSVAESVAHEALRKRGVVGWVGNLALRTDDPTERFVLDVAFSASRVGFEIDGFAYHGSTEQWHAGMARIQRLAELGWHVTRVEAA